MQIVMIVLLSLAVFGALLCLIVLLRLLRLVQRSDSAALEERLADRVADEVSQRQSLALGGMKTELLGENRASRTETGAMVQTTMTAVSDALTASVNQQFRTFSQQNQEALERIRATMQDQLASMRQDNRVQLERMRETVDEKLQKTLNDRITQSFQMVNQRLQEVYTGLGEMKSLASGVGDLKKVLSNVKTRGILGEYQLGAILAEILAPEQYEENVATKKGASQRVEYAIRLPVEEGQTVWLPVDAKFPGDTYAALVDAYDSADPERIATARAELERRILSEAKDIRDKYIDPPGTTEFAILFLPVEGLYAEAVRMGMVERLQRRYRVNIAGPTTFAALLNSLQMGFRTLAIQKRSGEVWELLGAVKTEFGNFETVLDSVRKRMEQTSAELDKLVGVRTRQINRRLKEVTALPAEEATRLLDNKSDSHEP